MSNTKASLHSLPELVRDTQLTVRFESDGKQHYTLHIPSSRRSPTIERWVSKERLGSGGQGVVVLQAKVAAGQGPPQLRAVKTIAMPEGPNEANKALYKRELEAMAKFSQTKYSEQFVKFLGWFTSPGLIHIAMEYCELGDLEKYLSTYPDSRLPESETQDITMQILGALTSMHEERFCHGDLKLANVLMMSTAPSWWVKLADFGLSKRHETVANTTAAKGTPNYMPPELLGYNGDPRHADPYPVDMWCLGQVAFRLAAGQPMFPSQADLSKYYYHHAKFRTHLLEEHLVDEKFIQFIQLLVAPEPKNRPSATDSSSHPWVQSALADHDAGHGLGSQMTESQIWPSDIPVFGTGDSSEPSASWPVDATTIADMTRLPARISGDGHTPVGYWDNEASAVWSSEEAIVSAQAILPVMASPTVIEEVWVKVSEADDFISEGDKFLLKKEYEKAIEQYKKALEIEPSSVEYMDVLCNAHMSIQAWNDAIADCNVVLKKDPKNPIFCSRAFQLVAFTAGLPEAAFEYLEHAQPPPPDHVVEGARSMQDSLLKVLKILEEGPDMTQALHELDMMEAALWPKAVAPYRWSLLRAEALTRMGTMDGINQAVGMTESISEDNDQKAGYLSLHGRALILSCHLDLGCDSLRKAIEVDPESTRTRNWLKTGQKLEELFSKGKICLREGSLEEAKALYTEALQVDLSNWCLNAVMLDNRALCEIELGNYPAAIADCDLALNLYPDLHLAKEHKALAVSKMSTMDGNISQGVDLRDQLRRSDKKIFHERDNSASRSMGKRFADMQVSDHIPANVSVELHYKGRQHIAHLPLAHFAPAFFGIKLRAILNIPTHRRILVERYSSSASSYVAVPDDLTKYWGFYLDAELTFKLKFQARKVLLACVAAKSRKANISTGYGSISGSGDESD